MSRRATVELRTARGRIVEEVEAPVIATDDAIVDHGRRQAGVSPSEFGTGRVIEP